MANLSLPTKYTEALFQAAMETNALPSVSADLRAIKEVLDSSPGLKKILCHPGIDKAEKNGMVTEVFGKRIGQLSENLLLLLIKKRRESLWEDICALFFKKMEVIEGTQSIVLETALPLDESEKARLVGSLEKTIGKKLTVETRIDPELVGGIRIRENLRQIDASAMQFIHSMRQDLLNLKIIPKIKASES